MTAYRRDFTQNATWFFTVALAERRGQSLLLQHIDMLGAAFRHVRANHPFYTDAIVVLPDHVHCIWHLPAGDVDYSMRWGLIKAHFSRHLPVGERRSESRVKRGERGIWQRRFWEHRIRDDEDYARHVDYIHWNPLKHGLCQRVADCPHSSFHRYVAQGIYPMNWCGGHDVVLQGAE